MATPTCFSISLQKHHPDFLTSPEPDLAWPKAWADNQTSQNRDSESLACFAGSIQGRLARLSLHDRLASARNYCALGSRSCLGSNHNPPCTAPRLDTLRPEEPKPTSIGRTLATLALRVYASVPRRPRSPGARPPRPVFGPRPWAPPLRAPGSLAGWG